MATTNSHGVTAISINDEEAHWTNGMADVGRKKRQPTTVLANGDQNLAYNNDDSFNDNNKLSVVNRKDTCTSHNCPSESAQVAKRKKSAAHYSDIFLKSDFHGLPELYEAATEKKSWSEAFLWLFIVVIALLILIIECWTSYKEFRDNPVITTYSVVAAEEGVPFPDVYLCPTNPMHFGNLNRSNVNPMWLQTHGKALIASQTQNRSESLTKQKSAVWEKMSKYVKTKTQDFDVRVGGDIGSLFNDTWTPRDAQEFFLGVGKIPGAGYPMDVFMQECAFEGQPRECSSIATAIFDGHYGKCFLIRVNDTQGTAGTGLSLVLNLDMDHIYEPPLFDGVMMRVEKPFDVTSKRKSFLLPGTYSAVNLEAKQMHLIERARPKLVGGSQRCTADVEMKVLATSYSRSSCKFDCVQQITLEKCDCLLPIDKQFIKPGVFERSSGFCNLTQQNECALEAVAKTSNQNRVQECVRQCQVACELWQLRSDVTYTRFPSAAMSAWVKKGIEGGGIGRFKRSDPFVPPRPSRRPPPRPRPRPRGGSRLKTQFESKNQAAIDLIRTWEKRGHIIVDIAFSSLEYIEITQEPSMTFTTFVGNIGGQVGLWIGASMITMVKFLFILVPICGQWCGRRWRRIRR